MAVVSGGEGAATTAAAAALWVSAWRRRQRRPPQRHTEDVPAAATAAHHHEPTPLAAVEAGFPYARYRALLSDLGLPAARVERALSISARTVARRRHQGRFTVQESDRIHRLELAWRATLATFGEVGAARGWLETPKEQLANRAPLELLATEVGGRLVERMLSGIEVPAGL